jgi:ComF family protein
VVADVLDWLFPSKCAACEVLGPLSAAGALAFCATCAESLMPAQSPLCLRCGIPFEGGIDHLCSRCELSPPEYVWARSAYQYGAELKTAIGKLKYRGRQDLARSLAPLLSGLLPAMLFDAQPDAHTDTPIDRIVPVPLHRKRLAKRQYNQALELACAAWPRQRRLIDPFALHRRRDTPSQAGLDAAARHENMRQAFQARPQRVQGRRIALVDDVITTGATVEACTRALLRADARSVVVVSLARAVL